MHKEIEQTFVSRGIRSHGWAFDWCESQPAETSLSSKVGDLKTPPLNYDQTVADGSTL